MTRTHKDLSQFSNIAYLAFDNKRLISKIGMLQMAYGNEVIVSCHWLPNNAR